MITVNLVIIAAINIIVMYVDQSAEVYKRVDDETGKTSQET